MAHEILFQPITTTKQLKNIKFFILISELGLELILISMLAIMWLIKLDSPLSLKAWTWPPPFWTEILELKWTHSTAEPGGQ